MTETSSSFLSSPQDESTFHNNNQKQFNSNNSQQSEKIFKQIINQDLQYLDLNQNIPISNNSAIIDQQDITDSTLQQNKDSIFVNSSQSGYQNISQLVADFEKATFETDRLTEENKKLKYDIQHLEEENQHCIQENDELRQQNALLTNKLKEINKDHKEELYQLQNENAEKDKQLMMYKKDNNSNPIIIQLQQQIRDIEETKKQEQEKFKDQIDQQQMEIEDLKTQLQSNDEYQKQIKELQNQLKRQQDIIDDLKKLPNKKSIMTSPKYQSNQEEIESLKAKIQKLSEDNARLKVKLETSFQESKPINSITSIKEIDYDTLTLQASKSKEFEIELSKANKIIENLKSQIKILENSKIRAEDAENKLKQYTMNEEEYKAAIRSYQKKIAEYEKKLKNYQTEIILLKQKYSNCNQNDFQIQQECTSKNIENESQTQLNQLENENCQLRKEIQEKEKHISQIEEQIFKLEKLNESLKTSNAQYIEQIITLTGQIKQSTTGPNNSFVFHMDEKDARIQTLENQLNDYKANINSIEAKYTSQIKQIQNENTTLKNKNNSLQENINLLQQSINCITKNNQDSVNITDNGKILPDQTVLIYEEKLSGYQRIINQLKQELDETNKQKEMIIQKLIAKKQQCKELKQTRVQTMAKVIQLQNERSMNETLQNINNVPVERIKEWAINQITSLNCKIQELQKENQLLNDTKEKTIHEYKIDNISLDENNSINELKKKLDSSEKHILSLQQELQHKQNQNTLIELYKQQIAELQAEIDIKRNKENENFVQEIHDLKEAKNSLQTTISHLNNSIHEKEDLIENQKESISKLKQEIKYYYNLKNDNIKLHQDVKKLKQRETTQQQIDSLTKQISNLRQRNEELISLFLKSKTIQNQNNINKNIITLNNIVTKTVTSFANELSKQHIELISNL